ncbi:MAG: M36 family metallopeptidase [Bacteroidia bacterium]
MTKTHKLLNVLFTISFLASGSHSLNAQQNKELLSSHLQAEQAKNNWLNSDITDYLISDQYTDAETGLTHAYIQQRHHNIIVFNAISVFLIKNNKVIYFKPGLIDHLAPKIKTDKQAITAEAAIGYALIHLGRTDLAPVNLIKKDENLNIYIFESPGISSSPIKVQLVYRAMNDGVFLSYDVSIEMKNEPHWYNVRVNALTGDYLDQNDFTANCNFDAPSEGHLEHYHTATTTTTTASTPPPPPIPAYNIFPFPIEAPTFGSRSLVTDPSDPGASPFGWHDVDGIAGNDFTITRGNNVYAYEDANNDNLPGFSPDTANLQFNYPYNIASAPLVNQNAAITNLFYVNNRIHDVIYHDGFTEAAGNFQQNNYGNGGLGNDKVLAEAFDGGGTNNANFSTPPDGSSGRMQMYLWSGTPQKDGSFDNGVIAHEYGHGVSNRLTGGPSQASCLGNAEQGGEGWSDWLALMMTIEPSDTGPGFLGQARGIGTYVLGQATTGAGIRRFRYSTNMSINPQTYADLATSSGPHQKGEIWCDAIWDMSCFLVNDLGFNSDPSVTTAGNNIAMRLVLEGMKLQPCSPGYIDGRDAILNADAVLYNNAHRCRIWEAFARRGMGYGASQGSSNSSTDQTVSFAMPYFCQPAVSPPVAAFTSNVTTIPCAGTVQFTDASVQAFNWNWNFGDQTTSTVQNPSHIFTSPGTYNVKLVVTNPLGSDSVTHTITVTSTYTATVTATPSSVVCGSPVQLNAAGSGSSNITYSVTSITYAPLSGTPINVPLNDDQMSTVKPIGFSFTFYGQTYTNFYICSNGFITFSSGQSPNVVYGEPIPSIATPNNFIALAWNDLYPQGVASAVSYFNTGVSPNQKLVVTYNTRHYGGVAYPFVVQAILSQGSNTIEIHTTTISDASPFDPDATTTQGVENAAGTAGVAVPGRNGTIFTASNDAYRFTPVVAYTYTWQPGNLAGQAQTVTPVATGTYTVNVADGSGCVAPFTTPLITVNPITATITGSTAFCAGSSTTLNAGSYASYNWSTGATTQTITVSTAGTFTVTVTNANGCTASAMVSTSVNNCASTLNLTAFLQGYYIGSSTMTAALYDLGLSTDPTATDTIEVNLWSAGSLGNSNPDHSYKTIIHSNGSAVVSLGAVNGNYYIAVKHRNAIETWSANPVTIASSTAYNFSNAQSTAYSDGINLPMKNMGGGVFAFYGGDVSHDGAIDSQDMQSVDNDAGVFSFGYNNSDCTGDGATDSQDMQIIDNNAQLFLFYARPY